MGSVILGLTISLDGFVRDREGSAGALYADFDTLSDSELMHEAIRDTGAVVMGWNTFAMAQDADSYADTYEFQVPIFVVSRAAPQRQPKENDWLTFTFVTGGIEQALAQAKATADAKDVTIVGGARTAQQALKSGLVDELHIDVMPVLLYGGLRLFEALDAQQLQLERINVTALPSGRTHLRFRVAA